MEPMRLQRFLSLAGVASRRAAEALMQSGSVTVNGRPATELGIRVDPERDSVSVDGRRVRPARSDYILFHKPAGCLTTRSDPRGRPTVFDHLPQNLRHLFPVGRLDWDTTGLLLFTNDGDLANHLLHPRYGVDRLYFVKVNGAPDASDLERMARGVRLRSGERASADAKIVARGKRNATLRIKLRQGRKGEVKDLCRSIGHPAIRIFRAAFGPLSLGELSPGTWRRLHPGEIAELIAFSRESTRRAAARPVHAAARRR